MTAETLALLAQAGPVHDQPAPLRLSTDLLLLLGAVVVLSLLFVVWAVFIRKRKADDLDKWRTHKHHHDSSGDANQGSGDRRHRRRRRREHRPRNPTLAETGGLPPARIEPPSSQSNP